MNRERNTIPVGTFKAQCLGLIDQVARNGETLIITKRGKPVARLDIVADRATLNVLAMATGFSINHYGLSSTSPADSGKLMKT